MTRRTRVALTVLLLAPSIARAWDNVKTRLPPTGPFHRANSAAGRRAVVGSRLLMRAGLLLLLAQVVVGCSFGSIWAPRVAGRIVDKESRQPIAGAPVFANYQIYYRIGFAGGGCCLEYPWTVTDADGRFEFAAHWMDREGRYLALIPPYPELHWLHPSYGHDFLEYAPVGERAEQYRDRDWENLELEMSRDEAFIRRVNESNDFHPLCMHEVDCWVACEAWFGGEAECFRRSGGRRLQR